jgi:hypothetical protein
MWKEKQTLQLSPKFQRRPVWKTPAKSFLIDTILREMTIPPLYIRLVQDETKSRTIREVVDGQQRVRAVLEFINEGFRLLGTLQGSWRGKSFSQLTRAEQTRIRSHSFAVEIFKGISDPQVLEVFCRLNMNGVPLNKQELRNGTYFGSFKQTSYRLAHQYLEFWRVHKLFSEQSIARMLEVELTSELIIAGLAGMQDKKKSVDQFYKDHEENFPGMIAAESRFCETMLEISEAFGKTLAETEFRRPPLFYTLYCVVYHHRFGMPSILRASPRRGLNQSERHSLREAAEKLSDIITKAKEDKAFTPAKKHIAFLAASARQTDNLNPRKERFNSLYDAAF